MNEKVTATYGKEAKEKLTKKEVSTLEKMLTDRNVNIPKLLEQCGAPSLGDLTAEQYADILRKLNG